MKTRRFKKLIGIREWFQIESKRPDSSEVSQPNKGKGNFTGRRKPDNRHVESLLFVSHTPGSSLRNQISTFERNLSFRTRVRVCKTIHKRTIGAKGSSP